MTSKVDMQEEIRKIIAICIRMARKTSDPDEGMEVYEIIVKKLSTLITTLRKQDLEEVKEDFPKKGWGFVTFGELRTYLDSKIKELGE